MWGISSSFQVTPHGHMACQKYKDFLHNCRISHSSLNSSFFRITPRIAVSGSSGETHFSISGGCISNLKPSYLILPVEFVRNPSGHYTPTSVVTSPLACPGIHTVQYGYLTTPVVGYFPLLADTGDIAGATAAPSLFPDFGVSGVYGTP